MSYRTSRRLVTTAMIVSFAAALSGCVSYGNTHALVTPIGGIGYHSFKPQNQSTPRDIRFPASPDRVAQAPAPAPIARDDES